MPYKLNIFSGTLDYYKNSSGVIRSGNTLDNHITRWDGVNSDSIQSSSALIQDGGAIEAQAYTVNRVINELITIQSNYTMLASNIEIEDGEIVIEADGELLIL